jgi:hypothetical protein
MAEVESARANPTLAGGEPASGANPPLTKSDGTEREDTDGSSDRDNVQRMQLEMLKRENAELGSKLETLTQQLRVRCDFADTNHIFESSFAQSDTLDRELCAVPAAKKQKKVPRTKEVLLVFEGDLQTCCRKTISAKLLHLKRLLHRRLEARLSPTPESLHSLMHVLLAARRIAPPSPQERLRVQASVPLSDEARETLRREILSVVSFTLGAKLPEEAVTFIELCPEAEEYQRSLCPQVASRPACVQVVITAFNHGTHAELRIQDSVLTEVCESESSGGSVSWARFMGKYVNVGFVNKDMMRLGQDDRTVVCSSASNTRCGSISLYFPTHLESFFTDRALRDTLQVLLAPLMLLLGPSGLEVLCKHAAWGVLDGSTPRDTCVLCPILMPLGICENPAPYTLPHNQTPHTSHLTRHPCSRARCCTRCSPSTSTPSTSRSGVQARSSCLRAWLSG